MEGIMDMVRSIRNLRSQLNVQAGHKARLMIRPSEGWKDVLGGAEEYFKRLANTSHMEEIEKGQLIPEKTVGAVCPAGELFIPLGDLVDLEKEKARLNKERENLENEIRCSEAKLQNPGFMGKAPEALVQSEREKLASNRQMLTTLAQRIAEMNA